MDEESVKLSHRVAREETTITAMIAIYCRAHHGTAATDAGEGLCPACEDLLRYARRRLENCRYGARKPTCANCRTHCYSPVMRERVREVMRYSGPRMLRRHPLLALAHVMDGRATPVDERRESHDAEPDEG